MLIGPPTHLAAASKRLQELAGACGLRYGDAKRKLYQHHPLPPRPPGLSDAAPTNTPLPADPTDPPPQQCPPQQCSSAPCSPAAFAPSSDIEDYLDQFPPGATVVRTCFKVGGVPVGLDRAAVSSWCNKKADVYGNFTKKLISLEIGAQNRFALLLFCGRPSAKLNHFFRITPPSLTTEAADIADAH